MPAVPRVIPEERVVPVIIVEAAEVTAVTPRLIVVIILRVIVVFVVVARHRYAVAILFYLYVIEITIVLVVVPHGRELGVAPRKPEQ
ncbi:MAG: hypothetical protein RhofKO_33110 [Rhodothermales bacterium]